MMFRHRVKKILISDKPPPRYVRAIEQARCNGGAYSEPPQQPWRFPTLTWFQKRREEVKQCQKS